jgi:hypothetical protein
MLSYVEAECIRLGADAAARHAALAASLLPPRGGWAGGTRPSRRPPGRRRRPGRGGGRTPCEDGPGVALTSFDVRPGACDKRRPRCRRLRA